MLPPINVCSPAPIVPTMDLERTMMPRTTPSVFTTRWPLSSNAVVVIAAVMLFYSGIAAAAQKQLRLVVGRLARVAMLEFVELAFDEGQVLHVVERDVDEKPDNQDRESGLQNLEEP